MTTLERVCAFFECPVPDDNLETPMPIEIPGATRNRLPSLYRALNHRRGAEIGVYRARYAKRFLAHNGKLHLIAVDPWRVYGEYIDFQEQSILDDAKEKALERLGQFPGRFTVLEMFSLDAAEHVPDESLDYVYIDGNHDFAHVYSDLAAWSKKVRPGGIVSGHDYSVISKIPSFQVVEAVLAYTMHMKIRPWFVLGRRHAPDGEARDNHRSFLWVKP